MSQPKSDEDWEKVTWEVLSNVQTGRMSLADAQEKLDALRGKISKAVREEIKREIMQQTMLNDGTDTFVMLGEALWVCDSVEDRKSFTQALTPKE